MRGRSLRVVQGRSDTGGSSCFKASGRTSRPASDWYLEAVSKQSVAKLRRPDDLPKILLAPDHVAALPRGVTWNIAMILKTFC